MIRFEAVSKQFADGTIAVDDLTLEIPKGQFCVMLGASGAGKSSVLKLVNGMVKPTAGRVEFEGTDVVPQNYRKIRPRIAMVHQQFNLVLRSTILRNVLTGALPSMSTFHAMLGLFPTELQRKACRLLEQVGLDEKHLYRRASHLSGGQQQRVAIARAFILDPSLVLADEPVASLDPEISRDILALLRQASRERGTTVMCSLHQPDLAREFADRIVALAAGRVIFDGKPEDLDEDAVRDIYAAADSKPSVTSPVVASGDDFSDSRGVMATSEAM